MIHQPGLTSVSIENLDSILSIETLNTNFSQILICVNFVGERKTSWGVGMKGSEEAKRGHCPSISKDRFEAASKMMMVMT